VRENKEGFMTHGHELITRTYGDEEKMRTCFRRLIKSILKVLEGKDLYIN
jgi:hypothetical protein